MLPRILVKTILLSLPSHRPAHRAPWNHSIRFDLSHVVSKTFQLAHAQHALLDIIDTGPSHGTLNTEKALNILVLTRKGTEQEDRVLSSRVDTAFIRICQAICCN